MKLSLLVGMSIVALTMSCTSPKHNVAKMAKMETTPMKLALKFQSPKTTKKGRGPASTLPEGLTPNSMKYSDHGAKPESGRSGLYVIQTRAYLNKDNKTTLDVTTGDFETGAMPGTHLTKIQVKGFNTDGEEVFTNNYNSLTNNGAWSQVREDLARHQKFQIFSHFTKDGIKRTFVVTTDSMVYLLPDLKADKIIVHPQAYQDEPINITGEVDEINNDLGAHADCVLFVDGSEVARTTGIWVDSGDRVSCNFTHAFGTLGTHTIKFAVENVKPSDYDGANNSVEKTINIVSRETLLTNQYHRFEDMNRTGFYSFRYTNWGYSGSYNYNQNWQQSFYRGHVQQDIVGGGEFSVLETSGDNSMTWSGIVPATDLCSGNSYWSCYQAYDYASNRYLTLNVNKSNHYSYVYYERYGGRVVYFNTYGAYAYLEQYNSEWGSRLPIVGYEYNLEVKVASGSNNFVGRSSLTLEDYSYNYDSGERCYTYTYDYYYNYCTIQRNNTVGKSKYQY